MSQFRPLSQAELAQVGIETLKRQADSRLNQPNHMLLKNQLRKRMKGSVNGRGASTDIDAPAFEVSNVFQYQSYFDSTLLQNALLRQAPNQPIVTSTMSDPIQVPGYGLALHPSSETPVAVQFLTGAQQGASPTYRLSPGETIWPHGRPGGRGVPGSFSGFVWGLPFGWLGGGAATLVVLRTADARVQWPTAYSEIIYHRMRLPILVPSAIPITAGLYSGAVNWPKRFPWPSATFGATQLSQGGQPALAVQPTRTSLSLNLATLNAASSMRMYFAGSDDYGQTSTNTTNLADIRAIDLIWSLWAQQAGAVAPFNTAFQTMMLSGEAERYAANAGAVVLASSATALQNQTVDVVRYGRL